MEMKDARKVKEVERRNGEGGEAGNEEEEWRKR